MKPQVLAYVQRKVITDWKRIVLTGDKVQFLYGSNDDHLFAKQKDGCTLWLVCSFPDRPPALAAKLDVEKVCPIDDPALGIAESILRHFRKRKWKWIARASGDSMFFGHNDAGSALVKTVFERPSGECWSLSQFSPVWLRAFGIRFLRPRLIHSDRIGVNDAGSKRAPHPLAELAATASRSVFISWKWRDNEKKDVLKLADLLVQRGFMVWLDQLAMPKSKALDKVQADEQKLEKLLTYGYAQCKYLLALNSERYGVKTQKSARNWTLREWEGAISSDHHPLRICLLQGKDSNAIVTASADHVIPGGEPGAAVERFAAIAANKLGDTI